MNSKRINWKQVKEREAHFLKFGTWPSKFPTTVAAVKKAKSVTLIYGQGRG